MPNRHPIDDTDTEHIDYSVGWQVVTDGSSRQWESSIHYTTQPGATATFRFSGYQVWIVATTSSGSGSNLLDVSIDGGPAVSISQQSNGSAHYNVQYFQSDVLPDMAHQMVITNRGSAANGHPQPFMLDKLQFITSAQNVTWPPASAFQQPPDNGGSTSNPPGSNNGGSTANPGSGQGSSSSQSQNSSSSSMSSSTQFKSSTSSSSSPTSSSSSIASTSTNLLNGPLFASLPPSSGSTEQSTVTATSTVTAAADFAHTSSKNTPVGAIAGGVIGAVALIILIPFFLLWKRRRQAAFSVLEDGEKDRPRRSPLAPNPFVLDSTTPAARDTNAPIYQPTHTPFSEKHMYRNNQLQPVSTDSLMALSNINNASNSNLLNNAGSSSDYGGGPSTTVTNEASGATLSSPSVVGSFDNAPPPSYTQRYHAVP